MGDLLGLMLYHFPERPRFVGKVKMRTTRDSNASALVPARKSSNGVLSSRLDFCEGPSSFLSMGFFLEMRGTSGDSSQVQFCFALCRGSFREWSQKAFPYGSSCGSND